MKWNKAQWIALVGAIVLLALHLDFWREQRPVLYFDWMPEELAYRVVWMALAWIYMLFFCSKVWQEHEDT